MIRSPICLALVLAVSLAACAPIDLPPPPAGAPGQVARGGDEPLAGQGDIEKRQRRLARSRDKVCEKHPDRCGDGSN